MSAGEVHLLGTLVRGQSSSQKSEVAHVMIFVLNAPLEQSNIMVDGAWSSQVAKDSFEFVYRTTFSIIAVICRV